MQCGAGARPEWNGKVLVALKKMTKPWEGGWDDCRKLKELQVRGVYPDPFPSRITSSCRRARLGLFAMILPAGPSALFKVPQPYCSRLPNRTSGYHLLVLLVRPSAPMLF